jgi:two-component system OmpR family sensor kinase
VTGSRDSLRIPISLPRPSPPGPPGSQAGEAGILVAAPAAATAAAPAGAGVCVLAVSDEGPELTAEQADRAFERFYRVDPSRSRRHGGGGLGLAIASVIARSHGGRLELDTGPGLGRTFRLLLPLP